MSPVKRAPVRRWRAGTADFTSFSRCGRRPLLSLVLLLAGAGCEQPLVRRVLDGLWDQLDEGEPTTRGHSSLKPAENQQMAAEAASGLQRA